jgi:hypothetical protein
LNLPKGCSVQRLSDPESRDGVARWLSESPDQTVYHRWPFIEFTRNENPLADVFLVSREGNQLFALTIHSWTGMGVESGYSGVVFPPTGSERTLRRSVAALAELFSANSHLQFRCLQSAQAPAYEDLARVTLLQYLIEDEGLVLESVYGRLSAFEHMPDPGQIPTGSGRHPHAVSLDADWLTADALRGYDPDTRNQIRQAVRRGLTVEYVRTADPSGRADAYARFQPLHEESWRRTGLLAKAPKYWPSLSESIAAGGGEDLVVLALDGQGEPLAGVTCHVYQGRAIYWSGCSSAQGLNARANPLCLHGAIAACRQLGAHKFEIGRFRAGETSQKVRAIDNYKAQFGGELVRITAFSTAPRLALRARTARANATFAARRQLAVALARARARADGRPKPC